MKNTPTLFIAIASVVLFQGCKKSSTDETTTTTTTPTFQAYINGTEWTPDTLSATVVYNASTKVKTFTCTGTKEQKQVNLVVKQNSAANNALFPVATYTVDNTANMVLTYSTQQLVSGSYVFVPFATAEAGSGSGSVIVSSIDTVAKTITGTFSFNGVKKNYDSSGNVVSLNSATISSGQFNGLPYKFRGSEL